MVNVETAMIGPATPINAQMDAAISPRLKFICFCKLSDELLSD